MLLPFEMTMDGAINLKFPVFSLVTRSKRVTDGTVAFWHASSAAGVVSPFPPTAGGYSYTSSMG
jgi:hypothetical protein